ncbi:MAG TPA: YafY family protein [Acidimicrobiales bacterium]|nr:YafY family protein [Acidimicrobiales bacterium]
MNRTERLYALVEEMRAVAPRPRTAQHLAARFEVSVRTVQRDLGALMEAGVPLYATPGPGGGYAIDPAHTLPPVNFTSDEAAALAIALARPGASPLAGALRSALRKVVAAMPASEVDAARRLAARFHLARAAEGGDADDHAGGGAGVDDDGNADPGGMPSGPAARAVEAALVAGRVVEIDYCDRHGDVTRRAVEPAAVVNPGTHWYLVGHCRLRDDTRAFRLDRVLAAGVTDEAAPERDIDPAEGIPVPLRQLSLTE